MSRRQYYQPQRYIVPGLPHLAAPTIPVYHPPYAIASMNSAPLFSQPDCCPICVRYSMMPYQQQCSPYLCYSGLSMPGSDVCRYTAPPGGNLPYTQHLPSLGLFRPPPYSSIPFPPPPPPPPPHPPQHMGAAQAPDRFDGSRNFLSGYNPSSHHLHVTRENDRSQSTIRYKANNTYNRPGFNPTALGTSQQHLQNGPSKSHHKHSAVTLRRGGTRRKKIENKSRHRRGTSTAGEPSEISCIVPINAEDQDTEYYETLDEEVNVDTPHSNDIDWPNATTLIAEALPLSNQCHTYDKRSSPLHQERNHNHRLPLDYTLITNDKSFSHVNFNPDMLPTKLDKMWIQIGTPKQRRRDKPHKIESDKTIRSLNLAALQKSPMSTKYGASLRPLTDSRDLSIRHLSDNQVYYVVRPAKNNSDIFTDYIEPKKKIHLQSCKGCTHKPRCAQCCCRLCNVLGEESDLTRSQVVSRVLEILDESAETWDNENSDFNSNNNSHNATGSDNAECRRLSAFSSISHCSLDKSQTNVDGNHHITDPNNNCPQDKSKEFWWDKSTDFGLKASNCDPHEGLNPEVELPEAFIREVDDFVVVDTAPKITMRNHDDPNNNCEMIMFGEEASRELEEDESCTPGSLGDRKKLGVDWNSIRSVVPKEYSSCTQEGTSEVYDINGTSLHNIFSMISDKDLSNHQTVPISDQDNAIVAFMSPATSENVDLENLEELSGDSLSTKNNKSYQSLQGKHVEAKRVSTPCIPSRVVSNWGKQDVRLLLIATSVSSSPSATTTWCPISASTPSCVSVALSTINPPVSLNTNNMVPVRAKPDNCSYRQGKSMPTTPIGCNMSRVAARTAKYMPSSAEPRKMENLQQWNTISETPNAEMEIDCRKFNIQKESHNIVCDTTCTTPVQLPTKANVLNTPLSPSPPMKLFSPQSGGQKKTTDNIERQLPIRIENVKTLHSQRGSFIPRLKQKLNLNRLPETVHSIAVQHGAQTEKGNFNGWSFNSKQPMMLDSGKSNPTSPCSTCTATPCSTPEYPSGSKTVTKAKRQQGSTSRPKRGARKTIIVPHTAKTYLRHSKSSSILPNAKEHTRTIGKKGVLLVDNAKNKSILETSASMGGPTSDNLSNKIVGTCPSTRRSPRTIRLSLTTKNCMLKKNKRSSKSCLPIVSCNKTTLDCSKVKVNDKTNDSTTLSEVKAPALIETSKYVSGLIGSVNASSGSSDISCPRETLSPPLEPSHSLIDVAHGRVHSTIKSIVHALVNQQSVYQPKATCSPSLAALRGNRCNPFNAGVLQTILSNSNVNIRPLVRQRPSTAPSSPTLCLDKTSLQSSRRSASLSDVFYDSTIDHTASVWVQQDDCLQVAKDTATKNNCRENVIFPNIKHPFIPLRATLPFGRNHENSASTYVGYSPPTLTPTQKVGSTASIERLSTQPEFAPVGVQCELTNVSPPIVPTSNTQEIPAAKYRSRVLSVELEKEIREKVELLVDSVRGVTVIGLVNNQKGSTNKSLSPRNVPERDSSLGISGQNDSVQNKLAESLTERDRRRSFDQSTQTQNNQLHDKVDKDFPKHKLTIPKKPPRSNSPNSNNVSSKDIPKSQHSYVGNPPIMPYYPLLTTMPRYSPHRHSHTHFLSPTFVPIGQSFYRGAGISGLVWPGAVSNQQNQGFSKDTKLRNSADDTKQPTHQLEDKSSEMATGVVMIPATNVLSSYYLPPPYPEVPHPSAPVRKSKPVIRRRRSFPGPISSASVAKARLNRRYGYSKKYTAQRFAKLSAQQQADINQSHPPPRSSIARRQRFVRSSLSDDAVFQSVEQKSRAPIFVTKPSRDKNPVFNDAQPRTKNRMASQTLGEIGSNLGTATALRPGSPSEAETGYSSGATSSGRGSPEKQKEEQAATTEKLDVILEEKQTVALEHKEPKQNYTIETEKHNKEFTGKNEGTTNSSSSGHHGNTSFHRIKRFKRFMSAKKGGSKHQSECATISSETPKHTCKEDSAIDAKLSTFVKKSKSQSKLTKKQDSSTNQGNKDNFRDMFRKARRVAATGEISDQSKSKGHNSDVVGASNIKGNTRWMRPPGHRQNFDVKLALLKPSFVAAAPAEIRDVKSSENDTAEKSTARRSISALYTTIQPTSKRRSVSTPGIRINSETGDVMEEGDSVLRSNEHNAGVQRVLSSTAIDADSLEEFTQSKTLKGDNQHLPSEMSDPVLLKSFEVTIQGRESNQI